MLLIKLFIVTGIRKSKNIITGEKEIVKITLYDARIAILSVII